VSPLCRAAQTWRCLRIGAARRPDGKFCQLVAGRPAGRGQVRFELRRGHARRHARTRPLGSWPLRPFRTSAVTMVVKSWRASFYCRGRRLPRLIAPGREKEWPVVCRRSGKAPGQPRVGGAAANPPAREKRGTTETTAVSARVRSCGVWSRRRRVTSIAARGPGAWDWIGRVGSRRSHVRISHGGGGGWLAGAVGWRPDWPNGPEETSQKDGSD